MVHVVKSADSDASGLFIAAVDEILLIEEGSEPARVALDCEGVNLSRLGSVELITICFSSMTIFLVDLGGNTDIKILKSVKDLCENDKVVKIIHDCRMDCDALFHHHGIKLNNVHDTSCFHYAITGSLDKNLNCVLTYNGINQNEVRDKRVYKSNHAFWATRPLTQMMVNWASSDVDKLFHVASRQLECCASEKVKTCALVNSNNYSSYARDMKVQSGLRVTKPIGLFIGRGGVNLRSLQRRTKTLVYQQEPQRTWFVYYNRDCELDSVKRSMTSR